MFKSSLALMAVMFAVLLQTAPREPAPYSPDALAAGWNASGSDLAFGVAPKCGADPVPLSSQVSVGVTCALKVTQISAVIVEVPIDASTQERLLGRLVRSLGLAESVIAGSELTRLAGSGNAIVKPGVKLSRDGSCLTLCVYRLDLEPEKLLPTVTSPPSTRAVETTAPSATSASTATPPTTTITKEGGGGGGNLFTWFGGRLTDGTNLFVTTGIYLLLVTIIVLGIATITWAMSGRSKPWLTYVRSVRWISDLIEKFKPKRAQQP